MSEDLDIRPDINSRATLETRVYNVVTTEGAQSAVSDAKNKYAKEFSRDFTDLTGNTINQEESEQLVDGTHYVVVVTPKVWNDTIV